MSSLSPIAISRIDPITILEAVGLGREMDADQKAKVMKILAPKHRWYNAGETICQAGDPADCLWLTAEGLVLVSSPVSGAEQVFIERSGPCVLGEVGFLHDDHKRSATMVAARPLRALEIPYARLALLPPEVKAIFWLNMARTTAYKLATSVPERAAQQASYAGVQTLLHHFVNDFALDQHLMVRQDYGEQSFVIWFSDLSGFSDVAAVANSDDVATLIRTAMTVQSNLIEGAGGHVDKFIGDAVMAFWPVDPSNASDVVALAFDTAEKAVAAIRAISLPPPHSGRLDLRIGLHIGTAHAGNFGSERRWAYTLIGHDVNYAARLEQARTLEDGETPAGPIRVSEEFRNHLPRDLQLRVPVPTQIRVKQTLVTFYSFPTKPT